jgi:hypothetical protein
MAGVALFYRSQGIVLHAPFKVRPKFAMMCSNIIIKKGERIMSISTTSPKTVSLDGKLLNNWRFVSQTIKLKNQSIKHQELFKSYKADLLKKVDLRVNIGGLANDNAQKTPDWSLFNTAHIHPSLNKIQKITTIMGLVLGFIYAALMITAAPVVTAPFVIYSYLAYGLVGTIAGYFSLWLIGGAIILSPIFLLVSLIL